MAPKQQTGTKGNPYKNTEDVVGLTLSNNVGLWVVFGVDTATLFNQSLTLRMVFNLGGILYRKF